MNINKKLLLSICLLFIVSIIGCETSEKHQKAYDSVDQIAKQGDSYNYGTRLSSGQTNDKFELKYNGFSGTDTIWILESKEDGEISVDYDSTVNNGDLKVVVAYPEAKEIDNIFEGTKQGKSSVKLKKGECRIKLVGKNADGNLKMSITENKNIEKINANKQ